MLLLLVISSCSDELYETYQSDTTHTLLKHITIKEVTDLNIQEMLNNPANRHGAAGRQITDTLNNFSIEDSLGVYIKIGDYDSYTFKIHRPNAPRVPLENLVISKTETGYEALLYIYDITEEELHKIEAQERVNLDGKLTKKLLNTDIAVTITSGKYYFNAQCYEDSWVYMPAQVCVGSDHHIYGDSECPLIGQGGQATAGGWVNTTSLIPCVPGGGTPNAPGGVPSTSGGSSGGVKGGTTPVSQSPQYMRKKKFQQENAACLSQLSVETLTPIFNYLETGNIQGTIFLGLGPNVTTYPPDRLNIVAEALEKMCQDPETFTSIVPFLIEDQINDNMNPCGNSVLNKLKVLGQSDIVRILTRFGSKDSYYKLTYNQIIPTDALGSANWTDPISPPAPYDYSIKIHPNVIAASTEISIAQLILHETVHAYFLSLIDDCRIANNCAILETFPEVWNYYVAQKNGVLTANSAQHAAMATVYVDIIGEALQEFVTNNPVATGQALQYYTDLAWYGLYGTEPWDALTEDERNRIESVAVPEILNEAYFANGITTYPQGTRNPPCL